MNIPSNVKKFVIIAGLGLLAAATGNVASASTCPASNPSKFCGYIPKASMPMDKFGAALIWNKALNQCAGQQKYVTYLNNGIGFCSKSYGLSNASCKELFGDITQPCAYFIDLKIAFLEKGAQQTPQIVQGGCVQNPWCGYQKGVSVATVMSGTFENSNIGSISSVSQNNCITYYNKSTFAVPAAITNWFNLAQSCIVSSKGTHFDPSCTSLVSGIGNTCAPVALPQY
jgi:hypothetical protein